MDRMGARATDMAPDGIVAWILLLGPWSRGMNSSA